MIDSYDVVEPPLVRSGQEIPGQLTLVDEIVQLPESDSKAALMGALGLGVALETPKPGKHNREKETIAQCRRAVQWLLELGDDGFAIQRQEMPGVKGKAMRSPSSILCEMVGSEPRPHGRGWHYVRQALLESGIINVHSRHYRDLAQTREEELSLNFPVLLTSLEQPFVDEELIREAATVLADAASASHNRPQEGAATKAAQVIAALRSQRGATPILKPHGSGRHRAQPPLLPAPPPDKPVEELVLPLAPGVAPIRPETSPPEETEPSTSESEYFQLPEATRRALRDHERVLVAITHPSIAAGNEKKKSLLNALAQLAEIGVPPKADDPSQLHQQRKALSRVLKSMKMPEAKNTLHCAGDLIDTGQHDDRTGTHKIVLTDEGKKHLSEIMKQALASAG